MKMKLKSRRVRPIEELWALEDRSPAVCGPSPIAYAARHGLKHSKSYLDFMRVLSANGNGAHKVAPRRRKLAAA